MHVSGPEIILGIVAVIFLFFVLDVMFPTLRHRIWVYFEKCPYCKSRRHLIMTNYESYMETATMPWVSFSYRCGKCNGVFRDTSGLGRIMDKKRN